MSRRRGSITMSGRRPRERRRRGKRAWDEIGMARLRAASSMTFLLYGEARAGGDGVKKSFLVTFMIGLVRAFGWRSYPGVSRGSLLTVMNVDIFISHSRGVVAVVIDTGFVVVIVVDAIVNLVRRRIVTGVMIIAVGLSPDVDGKMIDPF